VTGIPLHVWDEPLFKKIGSLFGVFVDFDKDTIARNRLDMVRIRISTARKGIIDEIVKIRVMGAEFMLWVVEEGGGRWCFRKEGVWSWMMSLRWGQEKLSCLMDRGAFCGCRGG